MRSTNRMWLLLALMGLVLLGNACLVVLEGDGSASFWGGLHRRLGGFGRADMGAAGPLPVVSAPRKLEPRVKSG